MSSRRAASLPPASVNRQPSTKLASHEASREGPAP